MDTILFLSKDFAASFMGLLASQMSEELAKANPGQKLIAEIEAQINEHSGAFIKANKSYENLEKFMVKYGNLIKKFNENGGICI